MARLPPPPDPREDQWAPENLGFLHIATITGPHGVKGEVKAYSSGEFATVRLGPGAHKTPRYLLLPGRRYPRPVFILSGRPASRKGVWILKVEGVSSREDVENVRGARLYVKDTDRPKLARGEFMIGDLVGSRVSCLIHPGDETNDVWYTAVTRRGEIKATSPIGVVDTVITRDDLCEASGGGPSSAAVANDLIEVATFDMTPFANHKTLFSHEIPETATRVLIPFVHQIVPLVNIEERIVVIDPPPGLMTIAVVNRKEKVRPLRGLLMPAKD